MRLPSLCSFSFRIPSLLFLFSLFFFLFLAASPGAAQTTQPFLFAATYDNNSHSTGFITLLRNPSTGALSIAPNTSTTFKDPCEPTSIDPSGRFLFGVCGDGLAMYTLDSSTGIVAETAASPYFASITSSEYGILVATESTGQYVYLLKVGTTQPSSPSTFTLDTFQIDPATPSLIPVTSQSLPFNATWVDSVADPAHHGIFIFANQDQGGTSPAALLFPISFDLSTGAVTIPSSGLTIGNNARSLAISPTGGYLALGLGDSVGSLTVFQISTTDFSLAQIGEVNLGLETGNYGSYSFPDSLFFSPGGNLLYVQAPPPGFSAGGLPFLVFDPSSLSPLSTPSIQLADAYFLNGLADPQAPFTYVGNLGPTTYGISVFQVDLSTGLPSQPSAISSPFFLQLDLTPLFVTVEQTGQGIQGPTLGVTPSTLTFSSTVVGQTAAPQTVTLKSLGTQSVSLTSIQISGANAPDFTETDTCISSPVLLTNHTCTISVLYSPTSVGTSQATLFITDNASGSPQFIPLSGLAVAPPPTSPAVTLNPASALAFPGTPTQGTSTAPQTVTLTNSGGAPLQILSAVLSGFNSSDFSISSDTCIGSIAANSSCTISVVFSPSASGIRTTTLTITDNAANSPQSLNLSGAAVPAATIAVTAGSSTTASLTAGQTAQFNLQAVPGGGFSGTLSFTCSGVPFGAACTVPASLPVSGSSPFSFTVSVSTLGASQLTPDSPVPIAPSRPLGWFSTSAFLAALCVLLFWAYSRRTLSFFPHGATATATIALCLVLVFSGIGCGGGGGTGSPQTPPPPQQTVTTPSIQPTGGVFTAPQSVSITDSTPGATIYYTTDGSTPTSASPVYSAPFSLNSPATVQAIASATGHSDSSPQSATFKFRTPAATYPITVNVVATPTGSSKTMQLSPIALTLIVN